MIGNNELYIKCNRCKKEIEMYQEAHYTGWFGKELEFNHERVFCSLDCFANDYQENKRAK